MRRALVVLASLSLLGCRAFTGDLPCDSSDNCPRQFPVCVEGNCEEEGAPVPDAGPPAEDAGPPAADAGPPAEDAGPPVQDAGLVDAGLVDAGGDAGPDGGPCPGFLVDHLVINEIDYDQNGTDDAEFVEILNPWCEPLPLTGVRLVFVNGGLSPPAAYLTMDLSSVAPTLAPGAYLVAADPAVDVDPGALEIALGDDIQNGSPDAVVLVDDGLIDGLAYALQLTASFDADGVQVSLAGQGSPPLSDDNLVEPLSLIRSPDGVDTDDADRDFVTTRTPTPGAPNLRAPLLADSTPGNCVDAAGAAAVCAGQSGGLALQDAAVAGPPLLLSAVGGEVIDERTGLRWRQQRPSLPGSFSGVELDCLPDRIPTRFELLTILDYGVAEALPVETFPEHPTAGERAAGTAIRVWSSTVDPEDAAARFTISLPKGAVDVQADSTTHHGLCVDDTDSIVEEQSLGFPSGDTILDARTGLEWDARDSQQGTFLSASDACAALLLGGVDDWRLPSIRELQSIIEEDPASFFGSVWPLFFNDSTTAGQRFLSSTPVFGAAGDTLWGVEFLDGTTVELDPQAQHRFRCVRGP